MPYVSLEWKKLAKNYFFFAAIAMVGLLYAYSFHNRHVAVTEQQIALDSATVDQQKKYEVYRTLMDSAVRFNKPFLNYMSHPANPVVLTRMVPRYGIFEQTPLTVLATGQSDLFNRIWVLNFWNRDPRLLPADIKNPVQLMFGQLDPTTVLILLVPLLIIAYAYNILSGERESGTLKIVYIQAQSLQKWMAAKVLLPATILFGFFLLETIILLIAYGVNWLQQPVHVVLFSLLLLFYILFWFGLALLLNLSKRSSANNAVLLVGCWLLFTFILPSLFNMLAYQSFGVPSRISFITTYRNAYGEAERGDRQEVLNKYFFDHPELVKPDTSNKKFAGNAFPKASAIFYEHVYEVAEPVYADYMRKHQSANRFAGAASFLSPATLMQNGLNEISNTSQQQFLAFQDSATRFRMTYLRWVKSKLVQDKELTWSEVDKLPSFEMGAGKISSMVWWVMMGLVFQCAVLIVWIQQRLKKLNALVI